MKRKKISILFLVPLLIILWLTSTSIVFAQGDQASSPGVSGQKPLAYQGTSLVDGGKVDNATDIPTNPSFKILFDKNVVNSLFWENNSKCFSMMSSNNETIPIKVSKVDDTVDFAQRQLIFVQPVNPLQSGTSYRLIISPNLQAKNGVAVLGGTTNGQGVTVTFKTKGVAVQQAAPTKSDIAPVEKVTIPIDIAGTGEKENSSIEKTSSVNTTSVNPISETPTNTNTITSSSEDAEKPSASSEVQNQSNKSKTNVSDNVYSSKNKIDEKTLQASTTLSLDETMEGGGNSSINRISIIGAVVILAWIIVEIILRKKRQK